MTLGEYIECEKLKKEIEILKEELNLTKNQLSATHSWICQLTHKIEEEQNEEITENNIGYDCECCWALGRP